MPRTKDTARRKVKSGCLTCKARKVKCDEAKPVCSRCQSTGRTCDGYGIWGGGGNDYADRYGPASRKSSTILSNPHTTNDFTSEECTYVQWFQSRVIHSVPGFLDQIFWTNLVAPGTWTEPAIMHAVIALSAAHRTCCYRLQGLPENQQRFTLLQYSKAIRHLQPVLASKDPTSSMVVLVTCLLFTFLEYLRGQFEAAALHLHMGLRLLKEVHYKGAELVNGVLIIKPASYKRAIDTAIMRGFASLHVQADLFGNHLPDIALVIQSTEVEMPSSTFVSLQEARDSMDKLLHGILLLNQRVRAAMNGLVEWSPTFAESQDRAFASLTIWRSTFHKTIEKSDSLCPLQILAYTILNNYHTMATIMVSSMFSTCESMFVEHTNDFIAIIERSVILWRHCVSAPDIEQLKITIDMNWIPPLYFTALKCRVTRIRSHAIQLLRSMPRKEGLWDSMRAANIAEKVKQLEEQYNEGIMGFENDFALDATPCISEQERTLASPETSLFHEVQVDLSEASTFILTCKKFGYHKSNIQRYRFDGERWHNLEFTELIT